MTEQTLFELPPAEERAPAPPTRREDARVLKPDRQQLQWLPRDLEAALAEDHPARAIWDLLEKMDLTAFYGAIKATLDRPPPHHGPPGVAGRGAVGHGGGDRQRPAAVHYPGSKQTAQNLRFLPTLSRRLHRSYCL